MSGSFNPGEEQKPGWGSNTMPHFDFFGHSISMHNGSIAIGAYGYDAGGSFSGTVIIYDYILYSESNETGVERTTWSDHRRITPGDIQSFSLFGWSVAIQDNIMIAGAYGDTISGQPYAGSAYVYERSARSVNDWELKAKLTAPNARAHDHFGAKVAVSGDIVAVSSQVSIVSRISVLFYLYKYLLLQRSSADKTIADGIVYLYRGVNVMTKENRNNGVYMRRWAFFKELHVYTEDSDNMFGYSLNMHNN